MASMAFAKRRETEPVTGHVLWRTTDELRSSATREAVE